MQRRATSKKRAAEAEKEIEINMEDKEATPVEDMEMLLPPAEPKQPAQPKIQLDIPTQTGDVNLCLLYTSCFRPIRYLRE